MKIRTIHKEFFPRFEPAIEKAFLSQYLNKTLLRSGIIFSWIILGAFGYLDIYYFPETLHTVWLIRFCIILPSVFIVYFLTFLKVFKIKYVPIVMATVLIVSYGITAMIYYSLETELGNRQYCSGLMIIILYVGLFCELRILQSLFTIAFIILGYLWVAVFKHNMLTGMFENPKFPLLLGNFFFLISCAVLSLVATFLIERFRRLSYMQYRIIAQEKENVEKQIHIVEEKNIEITDSINYAKLIQTAVLPHQEYMDKVMPEYFVLFKPRDIVSGDFYWIKEIYNYLIIVVADCTGHGVPGAFMSMLGISLLNEEVGKNGFDKPGKILDALRSKVKETLAQEGKDHEQQEGMEMVLAILDNNSKELQYAGANNSPYLIREKKQLHGDHLRNYTSLDNKDYQLFELKGDKQPVGFYSEETDFATKQIQLQEGDSIYLFTDGYVDQKGGPRSRKFLSKNLKKSLLEIQPNTMEVQHMILNDTLENWKKGFEQIDDILVMGIRV